MGCCQPRKMDVNNENTSESELVKAHNDPVTRKQLYNFPPLPSDGDNCNASTPSANHGSPSRPSADSTVSENIKRKKLDMQLKKRMERRNVQGERFDVDDMIDKRFKPKSIPKSNEIAASIVQSLHGHFLFSNLTPKQSEVVVNAMELETVHAGDVLIEEGTEGKKFYVVHKGNFDVIINTLVDGQFRLSAGKNVKTLGEGSNFGELALMYDCPRTATIVAKTDAQVFALDRQTFRTCVLIMGEQETRQQIETLQAVDVFKGLPRAVLDTISRAMLRVNFDAGQAVIEEGQEGSVFYIIESGELECTIKGKFIRTMKTGDFFGELALFNNEPRSATVVANNSCILLAMERVDFEALLGPLAGLSERMEKVHSERIESQGTSSNKRSDTPNRPVTPKKKCQSYRAIPISDLCIIKDVGRGAFGRVKVVRHKDNNTLYALKVMQKNIIVRTRNAAQVLREKKLLNIVQPHPLIVRLVSSMQDENCLYLLQEFINGGDLFHRLYNIEGVFPSKTARYYAACVTLMLEKLHSMNILYRDLKPENLLLNSNGVLKMVDFGMAKKVVGRTYTLCGTPEYMAPEVIHSVGHSKGVDYWALGVLIFEMICGDSPFEDPNNNHLNVYKNIEMGKLHLPDWLEDRGGVDLIRRLLTKSQTKRLGCLKNGALDVKNHPWFAKVEFDGILKGSVKPPIEPQIKDDLDISNFYPIENDNRIVTYVATGKSFETEWNKEF